MFPLQIVEIPRNKHYPRKIIGAEYLFCPIMLRSDNFINTPIITDVSVGCAIPHIDYSRGFRVRPTRGLFVHRATRTINELPSDFLGQRDSIISYRTTFVIPVDTEDDEPIFGSSNRLVDKFKKVCYNIFMMLEKRDRASKI